jgi:single-stranded-DNA-specific exonuclease
MTRIVRRSPPLVEVPVHPNPLAHRILASRGVTNPAELNFALAELPTPETLLGMDAAVARLLVARKSQQPVLIVGDYDCDGATSTTLAVLGLRALGFVHVDYLVPNRFEFGYGLSPAIVDVARQRKPDLIVTVDNGVASVEGVEHARALGIDVVVTDHHLPPPVLPRAVAIVNPNIPGATFPSGNLAGVGVVFYVLLALRAALAKQGEAEGSVNLAQFLDLVAIGTIADVVPLDRINRTLVEQGLRRIRARRTRAGVLALLECAGRSVASTTAADIGFALGPRLNAAGRLADMRRGIECLLTEDAQEAKALAAELDELNQQRRSIEQRMQVEADLHLADDELADPGMAATLGISLFDPAWHQGVIGIVAGRLKERLHKPVVVFTADGDASIKGSARSIPGVHIRDVLDAIATGHPGLINKFGGHAMAAGLSLPMANFSEFSEAFDQQVRQVLGDRVPERLWLTDGSLSDAERTLDNAQLLESLAPWGQEFEQPLFDDTFFIVSCRVVGKGHLKMTLRSVGSASDSGRLTDAIAFNQASCFGENDRVKVVYSLSVNAYRGNLSLQLQVMYIASDDGLTG